MRELIVPFSTRATTQQTMSEQVTNQHDMMEDFCNDQKRRRLELRKIERITYSIPIGTSIHSHYVGDPIEDEHEDEDDDDEKQDFDILYDNNTNNNHNNNHSNCINDDDEEEEQDIDFLYFEACRQESKSDTKQQSQSQVQSQSQSQSMQLGQDCAKSVSISSVQSAMSILSQPISSSDFNNSKHFASFNLNNPSFVPTLSPISISTDLKFNNNHNHNNKNNSDHKQNNNEKNANIKNSSKVGNNKNYERVMTLFVNTKPKKTIDHTSCDIMGILNNMSSLSLSSSSSSSPPSTSSRATETKRSLLDSCDTISKTLLNAEKNVTKENNSNHSNPTICDEIPPLNI